MASERRWSSGVIVVGLGLVLLGVLAGLGFSRWPIPIAPGATLPYETTVRVIGGLGLSLAGVIPGLVLVLIGTGRIKR